jgi:hypothetical protein
MTEIFNYTVAPEATPIPLKAVGNAKGKKRAVVVQLQV